MENTETVNTPIPQKAWQKGFPIEQIEKIKSSFSRYNSYAKSPFAEWNGPKIATSLEKGRLLQVPETTQWVDTHIAKTSTDIVMFYEIKIGRKLKGDRVINAISVDGDTLDKVSKYVEDLSKDADTWLYIWEEDPLQKIVAQLAGFSKVGAKITTSSEIYGIYFKNNPSSEPRAHPNILPDEKLTLVSLVNVADVTTLADSIAKKVKDFDVNFADHYSKHNKNKSWSAISLRGFAADPMFISKPICMNDAWRKEHASEKFELQDTELRKLFPEVEEIVKLLGTGTLERVRFMRLSPGGGELTRHTDQVEPDAGVRDGTIMRIHMPIITNPKVEFTVWDYQGEENVIHMERGKLWYLDIRKPHRAINGGTEERIHLVIDIGASDQLRALLPKNG